MRLVAFLFSSLVGYLIGHVLMTGAAAAYTSSIVSYHLYLGILILMNKKKTGLAMNPAAAVATHLAFMAVVVGLPFLRAQIPFFFVISLFIPALAPFEVEWLFSKGAKEDKPVARKEPQPIPIEELLNEATAEDHAEFLEYMKQADRPFRKPGRGVREEYGYWLADRANRKAALARAEALASMQVGQDSTAENAEA